MTPQVDKHIRRLDADLARFENELKEKLEVGGYESTDGRAVKSEARRLPRASAIRVNIGVFRVFVFPQKARRGG